MQLQIKEMRNARIKWAALAGLTIISFFLSMYKLSDEPLNSHECFIGLTAREMIANNDWVFPTCNGVPRLQKPPLAYWIVASFSFVTGNLNEFTVRAPGAFLAFLSVLVLFAYTQSWTNFRTGILAASVWVTSMAFLRHSHLARPDMYMLFFMLICMCSFYSAITAQSRRSQIIQMAIFWLSFALANLAKGPIPLIMLLPSLIVYLIVSRQLRIIPKLLPIIGPIIFLLLILPWPLAMILKHPNSLHFWKNEFVNRASGGFSDTDYSIFYYIPTTLRYLAPWSFFVVCAFFAPFFKIWDQKQKLMKYIWIIFVAGTVIMTFNAGKRNYYTMPLFPMFCVLLGILLEDMLFTRKAYDAKFSRNTAVWHIVILLAGSVGFAGYALAKEPELTNVSLLVAAIAIPLTLLAAYLFKSQKPGFAFATLLAIVSGVFVVTTSCLKNDSAIARGQLKQFCHNLSETMPEGTKYYTFQDPEVIYAYYLNSIIPEIEDANEAKSLYEKGGCIITFDENHNLLKDRMGMTLVHTQKDRFSWGYKEVDRGAFYKSK